MFPLPQGHSSWNGVLGTRDHTARCMMQAEVRQSADRGGQGVVHVSLQEAVLCVYIFKCEYFCSKDVSVV